MSDPFKDLAGPPVELPALDPIEAELQSLGVGAPVSQDELNLIEEQKKFDAPVTAAVLGAARGLSFGLSDAAGSALGYEDELNKYEEYNPTASTVGEVAGTIGGAFLGPGSLVAKGAQLASRGAGKALARTAVAGALEGAAYGGAQSISDISRGKTENMAENIVSNVGLGALTGGVFNVGAAGVGKGLGVGKKLIKEGFGNGGLKKASDDAALQFLGATGADVAKLRPDQGANMSQMVRDALTDGGKKTKLSSLNTSLDDVVRKVEEFKTTAGKTIGEFDDKISNLIETEAKKNTDPFWTYEKQGLPPLDDVVGFLQTKSSELKSQIGFEKEGVKLDSLIESIQKRVGEGYNFKDLVDLRRNVDKLLPSRAFQNTASTPELNAYYDVLRDYRSVLQKKALEAADKVQSNFGPKFKEAMGGLDLEAYKLANKEFSTASTILKLSNKGLAKDAARSPLSAIDYMLGGFSVMNPAALAALGLKKGYEKFQRPALIMLGNKAEETAVSQFAKIFSAQEKSLNDKAFSFATGLKSAGIGGSTVLDTKLIEDKEPARKIEEVEEVARNPQKFIDDVAKNTAGLAEIDPEVQQSVMNTASQAAQFLNSKAPKSPFAFDMFPSKMKWKPSDQELSQFNRYLKAIDDPLSIMDDMNAGLLTPEAVDAVKTVYPEIYSQMVTKMISAVTESESDLPFTKKLQLSMLIGAPVTSSQDAAFVQKLQQNAQVAGAQEDAQNAPKRQLKSDIAKNTMPQSERILTRGL